MTGGLTEEKRKRTEFLFRGDRIVNFRPVLFLSLGFGLGIFLSFLLGIRALWLNLLLLPALSFVLFRRLRRRPCGGLLLFFALLFALYSLGALSFSVRISDFERDPPLTGVCTVRGTAEEVGRTESCDVITLSGLSVADGSGRLLHPGGRMKVYVYGKEGVSGIEAGMRVEFGASPDTYDVYSYGRVNASAVIGGVRYRAFASAEDFTVIGYERVGAFAAFRARIRSVLYSAMDEESASLSYAMLTGSCDSLDEDLMQNFRYGGIAHVFSVSGLHIGVIYGLLYALMKKLRLRQYVRLPVISAVLVLYAGVCGFSPSAVRAVVMCIVPMAAELFGTDCDRTNSVALAAFVVLLINPVYLFSVGFQLSLAAAAGIIVLGGHLSRLLARVRFLPRRFSSAVAVSFSAQACTFPILVDSFGYTSGLSILLNLLFVPLISAAFCVLFAFTALACVFPAAAGVLLWLPCYFLRIAVLPVTLFEFRVLLICGFSFGGVCTLLWYLLCWTATDKINLRPLPKIILCLLLCAALTAGMAVRNIPSYEGTMVADGYYGSNALIVRREGKCGLVLLGEPDEEHLGTLFLKEGIGEIDEAVILASPQTVNAALPVVLRLAAVHTLYVPEEWSFPDTFRTVDVLPAGGFFSFCGAPADFIGDATLYMNFFGSDVLVCSVWDGQRLPSCDLLLAAAPDDALLSACAPAAEVYFEKASGKISVYGAGSLQIGWKDDIISVKEMG